MAVLEYTYAQYLETWAENYGDDERGETTTIIRGRTVPMYLNKLTEQEFNYSFAVVQEVYKRIDEIQAAPDYAHSDPTEEQALFKKAFPHESKLLI